MKFEYIDSSNSLKFIFKFEEPGRVGIQSHQKEKGFSSITFGFVKIANGQVVYNRPDPLNLTKEAENYLNKIIKLKAFW
jgi:hypothetical protein